MANNQRNIIKSDTTHVMLPNRAKRSISYISLGLIVTFTACEKKNVLPDFSPVGIIEVVDGNGNKVYRLDVTPIADQPTAGGSATGTLTVTVNDNRNTIYNVPFRQTVTHDEKIQIISEIKTSLENQGTFTPVTIKSVTSGPITVTRSNGSIVIAKPTKLQ